MFPDYGFAIAQISISFTISENMKILFCVIQLFYNTVTVIKDNLLYIYSLVLIASFC